MPLSEIVAETLISASGLFMTPLHPRPKSFHLGQFSQLGSVAHEYQSWIGKRLVRSAEAYAGPEPIVRELDLPRPYRIFTPERNVGDMMYDPRRTNIFLDANSIIVSITKG